MTTSQIIQEREAMYLRTKRRDGKPGITALRVQLQLLTLRALAAELREGKEVDHD